MEEIHSKIVDMKIVRNLIEKMRISGVNAWTSITDVVTSQSDRKAVDKMVKNGLLQDHNGLVRFATSRIFSLVDSKIK